MAGSGRLAPEAAIRHGHEVRPMKLYEIDLTENSGEKIRQLHPLRDKTGGSIAK